ncbi:unnamed protein product [Ambrosiozyma monospora]|uniref:Unnamed protein product n=1 Tax=Ambrosiozyma monospora TaxID=43982 RepID=A0ACB5T1U0_AMBMO|nr:unnamed protein product [Ambrosiozyma monospora]
MYQMGKQMEYLMILGYARLDNPEPEVDSGSFDNKDALALAEDAKVLDNDKSVDEPSPELVASNEEADNPDSDDAAELEPNNRLCHPAGSALALILTVVEVVLCTDDGDEAVLFDHSA